MSSHEGDQTNLPNSLPSPAPSNGGSMNNNSQQDKGFLQRWGESLSENSGKALLSSTTFVGYDLVTKGAKGFGTKELWRGGCQFLSSGSVGFVLSLTEASLPENTAKKVKEGVDIIEPGIVAGGYIGLTSLKGWFGMKVDQRPLMDQFVQSYLSQLFADASFDDIKRFIGGMENSS